MEAEPSFIPQAPHIAKSIGKTADGVYRQMEEASRDHMAAAAEMTGGDISEFAGMAINDMPDYLRPGDIAASVPALSKDSPVVAGAGFQGATGQEYAAAVGQGVLPHRGAQMQKMVGAGHADRVQRMVAGGLRARG